MSRELEKERDNYFRGFVANPCEGQTPEFIPVTFNKLKTEGVKFDEDKPRLGLLPYEPLREIAKVLTFGAKKYTRQYKFEEGIEWLRSQIINASITPIKRVNGKGYAVLVTKNISKKQIQCTQNDKRKTEETGISVIKNELQNMNESGVGHQNIINIDEIDTLKQNTELQNKSGLNCWINKVEDVLSVGESSTCIRITTTPQTRSEEYYAVGAITASDFLMILLKVLKQHSLISRESGITTNGEYIVDSGDWNWARGFVWSRVYDSLYRHLGAWTSGVEDKDPETGLSHLAHAGCNILFLLYFELFGVGTDDRRTTHGVK